MYKSPEDAQVEAIIGVVLARADLEMARAEPAWTAGPGMSQEDVTARHAEYLAQHEAALAEAEQRQEAVTAIGPAVPGVKVKAAAALTARAEAKAESLKVWQHIRDEPEVAAVYYPSLSQEPGAADVADKAAVWLNKVVKAATDLSITITLPDLPGLRIGQGL